MADTIVDDFSDPGQERANRVRIGITGLATIVLIVLLAATFSGTASNEPELTPEGIAEQAAQDENALTAAEEQPQEPLAELGVAPGTGPVENPVDDPVDEPPPAESTDS